MSDFVDWALASRVARAAAGDGPQAMTGGLDLGASGEAAVRAVLDYTGLTPGEALPPAEWVSRRAWAEINLASMRELIAPVEERLAGSLPSRGRAAISAVAGRVLAVEIGALLGLISKRVLGQYEFSMRSPERAPRLLFVGPNIEAAARQLEGRPGDVLDWVALHEVTHAAHFAAAPWLRGHLGVLSDELLAASEVEASSREIAGRARELLGGDPRQALARLRESDPFSLLAPAGAQAAIAEVQATMAAIEGYAEHVMDAAAGELGSVVPELRAAMERRRQSRSPLMRLISWLLGFELKLRQYKQGKVWADEVAAASGVATLNEAWRDRESLPSQAEIADPAVWLRRVAGAPIA